jgi:hypothetical protein
VRPLLTNTDFERAAATLGVPVAAVRAVCEVEAPNGGFDSRDQPRILFEGHVFHRLTGGIYDAKYPTISYPTWTRKFYARGADADERNRGEHDRLDGAVQLRRAAALMSASWGKFQIMGENYALAGHTDLQSFINAMFKDEASQLDAFVQFVMHAGGGKMWKALKARDWPEFARRYNGPAYAENQYDTKLSDAFDKYA